MMTKTITMPLKEYEQMQKEIEQSKENNRRLLKNSIGLWYNEICKPGDEPKFRVDLDGICKRIREKTGKDYEFEFKASEIEFKNQPTSGTTNCNYIRKSPEQLAQELAKRIQHAIDAGGR